jgi:hypothetical protein
MNDQRYTLEETILLICSWPEGTRGYIEQSRIIAILDTIGKEIGYGALEQMTHWLYQIRCLGNPKEAVDLKRERFAAVGWELPENFEELEKKNGS